MPAESAHRRLARDLDQRIRRGDPGYGPGWVLPSAARLARQHGVGVDTAEAAYALLANMGLVVTRRGYGVQVRPERDRETVHLPPGTVVTARMPTFAELDEWQLDPGVPMLAVDDGRAWPADRYQLAVGEAHSGD